MHHRSTIPLLWLELTDAAGLPELIAQHTRSGKMLVWVLVSGNSDETKHSRTVQIILPLALSAQAELSEELVLEVGDVLPTVFDYVSVPLPASTGQHILRSFVVQQAASLCDSLMMMHKAYGLAAFPVNEIKQLSELTRAQRAHNSDSAG